MVESDPAYNWKIWLGAFLIILFLIIITIVLVLYRHFHDCSTDPIIWCFEDWLCPEEPQGSAERNPATFTNATAKKCTLTGMGNTTGDCENVWPFLFTS